MEQKSIEKFEKLVSDFRVLITKVQKDNRNKTKKLKRD